MCREHMRPARSDDGSPGHGNQQLGPTDTFQLDSAHPPGRLAGEVIPAVYNPGVSGVSTWHRLLVTWRPVSAAFGPEALRSLLQQFGPIQSLATVQDTAAAQIPGCAFVTYATEQAAAAAVAQFGQDYSGQQQLPPGLHSIQVQYVDQAQEPLSAHPEISPPQATPQDQQQQQLGQQRATAFGLMQLQTGDISASAPPQQQLQEQEHPQGSEQRQQQGEEEEAEQPARQQHTLFFAKVPRSASRSAILELFSSFGEVVDINLFAEHPDAPVSKGCGLVMFADRGVALRVLQQLGGRYTWNGMRSPMVLKLINPDQRRQQQQQQQQQQPRGLASAGSSSSSAQQQRSGMYHPGPSYHQQVAAGQQVLLLPSAPAAAAGSSLGYTQQQQQLGVDQLPLGCSSDAYKLFVGNIPKSYSAGALRPVFEQIGPVAEVVIIRDRSTSESKGSAFVWFNRAVHADQAIAQLHMRVVLPGWHPSDSAHGRPLVVKRASQQWRTQLPPGGPVMTPPSTGSSSSRVVAVPPAAAVGVRGSEPAAVAASEGGTAVARLPVVLQQPPPPTVGVAAAAPAMAAAPTPAAVGPTTGANVQLGPVYVSPLVAVQQQQQFGYPQQRRPQALQQQPVLMQQQLPVEHNMVWQQQQVPVSAMMQQGPQQQQRQPGLQQAAPLGVASIANQLGALQLQQHQQQQVPGMLTNQQLIQIQQQQQQQQQALPGGMLTPAALAHPLLPEYALLPGSAAAAGSSSLGLGVQQQRVVLHVPRAPGPGQLIQHGPVQGYGFSAAQDSLQTAGPAPFLATQANTPHSLQHYGLTGVQGYPQAGQIAAPAAQEYGVQGNLQLPVQGYSTTGQAAAAGNVQGYGAPVSGMQGNSQRAVQGYMQGPPALVGAAHGSVVQGMQGNPQLGVSALTTSVGLGTIPSTQGYLAGLGPFGL